MQPKNIFLAKGWKTTHTKKEIFISHSVFLPVRWFYLKSVHNGSKLPIDLLIYVHTKPKLGPIYSKTVPHSIYNIRTISYEHLLSALLNWFRAVLAEQHARIVQ